MIGDTHNARIGGLYWREMGPWQCSDMLKGGAVTLGGMCSDDHLENSLFNVFVDADFAAEAIRTILLLENRNLIAQLNFDPAQAKFGK